MADDRTASSLAGLLGLLGWSAERLARRLNDFAAQQGRPERIHPKTPYKWLNGETPRPPWRSLTAALLTSALHREVAFTELGWPPDGLECQPADAGLSVSWDAPGALRALITVTHAGAMDRRLFLTLLGSAATSPAHEWLIAHQAPGAPGAGNATVPMQVVDHLDQITSRLRRMDDQLGSGNLLTLVHHHLHYVTELLNQGRYPGAVGQRLHSTAAELLRLAGFLCFDSGQHARAQRYWIAALHTAHAAGDRALGANILGFMSCQAKDIGQIREAVALAETALAGYRGATPAVTAILQLRAAEAHANVASSQAQTDSHAIVQVRRSIDAAFDTLESAPPSSGPPDWCYWMDHAQAHAQAGYCYLNLGDHTRARAHLRRGLALQDASYTRESTLRHILLATTYLKQAKPELDKALTHGNRALDTLADKVDSTRCVGHLSRLVDILTPYCRSVGVTEFFEQAHPVIR